MAVYLVGIIVVLIIAVLAIICFVNNKDSLGFVLLLCDAAVISAWYVCTGLVFASMVNFSMRC